jgi:hypothetical protein
VFVREVQVFEVEFTGVDVGEEVIDSTTVDVKDVAGGGVVVETESLSVTRGQGSVDRGEAVVVKGGELGTQTRQLNIVGIVIVRPNHKVITKLIVEMRSWNR